MYILFDLNKNESYKTTDLQNLRNFVSRNFNVSFEWWKLGTGAKVLFSSCGNYSIEIAKTNLKGKHLIQTIASDDSSN
jgi:hypothetical protein